MIIKMHFRSEQKIDFLGPFDSDLLCTCFCIKTDIFSFVQRNDYIFNSNLISFVKLPNSIIGSNIYYYVVGLII